MYLNQYITQVQRLLHDTNAQYWSVSELTDYINEARNRVAKDTRCCRQQLLNFPIVYNTEQYTLATVQAYAATALGVGYDVVDVMGINIYWGSTRIKLAFLPWTRFDVQFRYWTNMQSRPVCYSKQGMTNIFVGPIPDQNYNSDWDVSLIPPPLAATSAVPNPQDTDITEPFATSVKYYAAYLAKFREQAMGEANIFEQMYLKNTFTETKAYTYRIIPDPYAK